MAKSKVVPVATGVEVVEELHEAAVADDGVEFVDVTGKDDLPEGVADTEEEEERPTPKAKAKPEAAAKVEDDVPAELKGKTPAQLAKMYKDAQSVIGRQGKELGDLRSTADTYIKAHLRAAAPKPAPVVEEKQPDDVDFFTDPKGNIARAIENHPSVKELRGANKEYAARELTRQRESATAAFNKAHPDAAEVMADEGFRAWVAKSPIRQAMILRAHQHYDMQAGDEVFSTWKELKAARTPVEPKVEAKPTPKKVPVAGKEAARVPTGGNATPTGSKDAGGKIFRRADVIRLMEQDPDRYQMMADEITRAYQEGRVR